MESFKAQIIAVVVIAGEHVNIVIKIKMIVNVKNLKIKNEKLHFLMNAYVH